MRAHFFFVVGEDDTSRLVVAVGDGGVAPRVENTPGGLPDVLADLVRP